MIHPPLVPQIRDELIKEPGMVYRIAMARGQVAVARHALRDIAELKGMLKAPPPATANLTRAGRTPSVKRRATRLRAPATS
jgi:hypothetical protein